MLMTTSILILAYSEQLTDPDTLVRAHASNIKGIGNGTTEFKLKRSDSMSSVNSYFFKSTGSDHSLSSSPSSKKTVAHDLEHIYLRLCLNCCALLEKKYKVLKDKLIKSNFTDLYNVTY